MGELARGSDVTTGRWYSQAQVESGAGIFQQHCASCHGREAEGLVADWRARQADGSLPPPPLNGSAHAWHHPLPVLLQVINDGGAPYGGKMPAFAEQLSATEKRAAIAYFQDFWDDEIYQQWLQMGGIN
ncbi:MAG: c-type cytochrome [Pseudohongiellaceae bacterium]|jgi:mono/diheme cytochrome c family protein